MNVLNSNLGDKIIYRPFNLPTQENKSFATKELGPIPDSFIGAIVGRPGTGKTQLIPKLLNSEYALRGKFDNFFFMTPSGIPGIEPVAGNWTTKFDLMWLYTRLQEYDQYVENIKLEEELMLKKKRIDESDPNNKQVKLEIMQNYVNPYIVDKAKVNQPKTEIDMLKEKANEQNNKTYSVLVVIDDMVADIQAARFDKGLKDLIFNRRHVAKNFEISLIITSQKYNDVPAFIRTCLNWVVIFCPVNKEWDTISKEQIISNNPTTIQRIKLHFRNSLHNFIYIVHSPKYGLFLDFSIQLE
jgi:Poxvirus A32 protein